MRKRGRGGNEAAEKRGSRRRGAEEKGGNSYEKDAGKKVGIMYGRKVKAEGGGKRKLRWKQSSDKGR